MSDYIVVLDDNRAQATGHIRYHADQTPAVWTWCVTIDEADFANGATLSLRRAKEAVLVAWKGYKRVHRALRPLRRRRAAAPPQEIDGPVTAEQTTTVTEARKRSRADDDA